MINPNCHLFGILLLSDQRDEIPKHSHTDHNHILGMPFLYTQGIFPLLFFSVHQQDMSYISLFDGLCFLCMHTLFDKLYKTAFI